MIVRRNFAIIAKWMHQVATEISNAYTRPTCTLLWSFHKFYNCQVTRSCTIYRDESYNLMSSPCGLRMSIERARYARFSRDKADNKTNERFSVVRTIIIIVSPAIRHEFLIENRIKQRIFPCLRMNNSPVTCTLIRTASRFLSKSQNFPKSTERSTKETKGNVNVSSLNIRVTRYSIAAIRRFRVTQVDRTGENGRDGREIHRKKTTVRRLFSRHGFIFTLRASFHQIAVWTRYRGGVLWNFRILLRLIGRTSTFGAVPARNPGGFESNEWKPLPSIDFLLPSPVGTFEIFPMCLQTPLNPSNRPVSRPFQLANANTISSWDYSKLSHKIRSNYIFSLAYFSPAYWFWYIYAFEIKRPFLRTADESPLLERNLTFYPAQIAVVRNSW